jgi:hypothetical protein
LFVDHFNRILEADNGQQLSRAWVYQERVLAPRTVHFHATEMLWECISSSRCECGGLGREKVDLFRPRISGEAVPSDIDRQWCSVVQQYSGLNASHSSDKFPALSGIAEHFHAKLQCDYLAGLWRTHLLRGLQWVVADGNKGCRRLPYRAPTWSWASLDKLSSTADQHHGIRVTYDSTQSIEQDKTLAVVAANVRSLGENPYGAVRKGGVIVLKATYFIPCQVEIETELSYVGGVESILLLKFNGDQKDIRVEPDIAFASLPVGKSQAPYDAEELRWIVLGKNKHRQHGLLLKLRKVRKGKKEVYERVGLPSCSLMFNFEGGKDAMFKIL